MKSRIKKLEHQARKLEIPAEGRRNIFERARQYGEEFLSELPGKPAYVSDEEMSKAISNVAFGEEPKTFDRLLELVDAEVDNTGLNPASGKHAGYIPGGGIYPSAIADYLAAVTNRYAGIFFSSPGAVRIENRCIRWMCDLIGYPQDAAGNLTSGGSIANLIAMVAARDDSGIKAEDFDRAVIYTTHQVHHCVVKAIKFAGLQGATLRTIQMDERYRMNPDNLTAQVQADKEEGLIPLMIFASAGTTDLGAVDPLNKIADIANRHNLWFHADAAYGGFFLLTDHGKKKMVDIARADSVCIDPHKGLFLPYGTGAVLVKEGQKLYESQHMSANYMQDTLKATEEYSPADLSPELSKHFRGLRMWLPLQLFGVIPFRAALGKSCYWPAIFMRKYSRSRALKWGLNPSFRYSFFAIFRNKATRTISTKS